jgi:lipopolysaccharide export LptBFGC system permease protein LptF
MERLVDPIVADLQAEYAAFGDEKAWRRRRVLWSAYVGFWKAMSLHVVFSLLRQPPGETARFRHIVTISVIMLLVFTALLTLPPLLGAPGWPGDLAFRTRLALLLIPQALPLSIPAAVCIGIMYAMRAHRVTRRDLYGVLAIAVLASGAVWAVMAWGMPGANQAFRELISAKLTGHQVHIEPGLAELGFSGLAQRTDAAALRVYHLRWALAFAALPLSLLALSIAQRIRGAMTAVSLAFAAVVVYYAALWVSDSYLRGGVTLPLLSAWAPNAIFLAAALGLSVRWRHSRLVDGPSPP